MELDSVLKREKVGRKWQLSPWDRYIIHLKVIWVFGFGANIFCLKSKETFFPYLLRNTLKGERGEAASRVASGTEEVN